MSNLLVVGFKDKHRADEVMLETLKQPSDHLVDLEDAVVVTKNEKGHTHVKPYYDLLTAVQGRKSEFWGAMIFSLIKTGNHEDLSDIGLTKETCQEIFDFMSPNSSAIFALLKRVDVDRVKESLAKYEGTVFTAPLLHAHEEALAEALTK
ncbi:MAG: DUF1269 domain-containing protein [Cyanobacteria bacterium P01_H01_bin.15]